MRVNRTIDTFAVDNVSPGRQPSAVAICENRLLKVLWLREYRIASRLLKQKIKINIAGD